MRTRQSGRKNARKSKRKRASFASKALLLSGLALTSCLPTFGDALRDACDHYGKGSHQVKAGENIGEFTCEDERVGYTEVTDTYLKRREQAMREVRRKYDEKMQILREQIKQDEAYLKALKEKREPPQMLDFSTLPGYLKGRRVVLFGEAHGFIYDNLVFQKIIPVLKEAGFTHLGMELDVSYQRKIDEYAANRTPGKRKELVRWLEINNDFKTAWDSFVGILDVALDKGIKVVCIDRVLPEDFRNRNRKVIEARDRNMKQKIDEVLADGGKVAVFIGALHAASKGGYTLSIDNSRVASDGKVEKRIFISLAEPLGKLLVKEYGEEEIGLVGPDLPGVCENIGIKVCFKPENIGSWEDAVKSEIKKKEEKTTSP